MSLKYYHNCFKYMSVEKVNLAILVSLVKEKVDLNEDY